MPHWLQIIVWIAVGIVSVGTILGVPALIWKKMIKPGAKLVNQMDQAVPLMEVLVKEFHDKPEVFTILHEIASQFRTDSGSSLRDVVNRLEATAKLNQTNVEALRIGGEATKQIAIIDRSKIDSLALVLDRLSGKVESITDAGLRMELKAIGIADDLMIAQKAVDGVAQDLADSHKRADETHHTAPAGTAADAAAQQTAKEKAEDNSGEPEL